MGGPDDRSGSKPDHLFWDPMSASARCGHDPEGGPLVKLCHSAQARDIVMNTKGNRAKADAEARSLKK
jgi:hypothetical protein